MQSHRYQPMIIQNEVSGLPDCAYVLMCHVCVRSYTTVLGNNLMHRLQHVVSNLQGVHKAFPLVAGTHSSDEGRVGFHSEVGLCTVICELSLEGWQAGGEREGGRNEGRSRTWAVGGREGRRESGRERGINHIQLTRDY